MRRLALSIAATFLVMMEGPAAACEPPSIQFDLGSARIGANNRWAKDEVVGEFRARPGRRVGLTAQTDGIGSAAANVRLARRRGEAVRAALVRRGVPARAIDIVVEGEGASRGADSGRRLVWLSVEDGGCSG